jgi:hypothetical protein
VLAGPGALSFGAEKWRSFGEGQFHREVEGGLGAEELWRRGLADRSDPEGGDGTEYD